MIVSLSQYDVHITLEMNLLELVIYKNKYCYSKPLSYFFRQNRDIGTISYMCAIVMSAVYTLYVYMVSMHIVSVN